MTTNNDDNHNKKALHESSNVRKPWASQSPQSDNFASYILSKKNQESKVEDIRSNSYI